MTVLFRARRHYLGFSLLELMISLVLGLLLMASAIAVFLANREIYRQNENLARLQENARYVFELIARDLREAGGTACGSNLPTANVLNGASNHWWSNWGHGIRGYEGTDNTFPKAIGTGATDRVAGTDAVVIHSATVHDGLTVTEHNEESAQFKVNTTAHGLADGDIVLACDYRQAAIFQVTNANSENVTIVHNTGGRASPGNCSKGLGYPTRCTATGTPYTFEGGGLLSKLTVHAWYIGFNGRGGRSLYRMQLTRSGSNADIQTAEVAEGITDLQIEYLSRDCNDVLAANYVSASSIPATYCPNGSTDWTRVISARIALTLESLERVGTGGQTLRRNLTTTVTLRNRQT